MRGEEKQARPAWLWPVGSPPHARGRGVEDLQRGLGVGITPACAGKSHPSRGLAPAGPDHPRMRGEEAYSMLTAWSLWGSPPHARGRGVHTFTDKNNQGITPACAGKSQSPYRSE